MSKSPQQKFVCSNGHEFSVSDVNGANSVDCPECHATVSIDSSAPKKRGGMSLWAVMQSGNDLRADEDDAVENADDKASAESQGPTETVDPKSAPDQSTEPVAERRKGLWALMGGSKSETRPTVDEGDSVSTAAEDRTPSTSDERSARGIPGPALGESKSDALGDKSDDTVNDEVDDEVDDSELVDEQEHDGWEIDDPDTNDDFLTPGLPLDSPPAPLARPAGKPTGSYVALGLGAAALLLSTMSLMASAWARYPATLVGVVALVLGYQALGECKRSKRASIARLLPTLAMLLGVLGMFAGPLFLNQLGAQFREDALHSRITVNMKTIDRGLSTYHERHDRFPPGSKHEPDTGGIEVPMHSWMTAILPHIGEDALVNLIDSSKPFDHDVNFEAMRRVVPAYLVPGVPHHANHLGYATGHFAGVGGQQATNAGLANLGIFERNSTTSRNDITDGISQTMLVGEVSGAFPAWGEPDNWRSIGKGLNQQITGFGNAEGTGAHFLMADGSVRFFPNNTALEVLQALSTRDGGDPVTIE